MGANSAKEIINSYVLTVKSYENMVKLEIINNIESLKEAVREVHAKKLKEYLSRLLNTNINDISDTFVNSLLFDGFRNPNITDEEIKERWARYNNIDVSELETQNEMPEVQRLSEESVDEEKTQEVTEEQQAVGTDEQTEQVEAKSTEEKPMDLEATPIIAQVETAESPVVEMSEEGPQRLEETVAEATEETPMTEQIEAAEEAPEITADAPTAEVTEETPMPDQAEAAEETPEITADAPTAEVTEGVPMPEQTEVTEETPEITADAPTAEVTEEVPMPEQTELTEETPEIAADAPTAEVTEETPMPDQAEAAEETPKITADTPTVEATVANPELTLVTPEDANANQPSVQSIEDVANEVVSAPDLEGEEYSEQADIPSESQLTPTVPTGETTGGVTDNNETDLMNMFAEVASEQATAEPITPEEPKVYQIGPDPQLAS